MPQPKCQLCTSSLKLFNHKCRWHETGKKTPHLQRLREQESRNSKYFRERKKQNLPN